MAVTPGNRSAVRSHRLASELHRLRKESGLSGEVAAGHLGWSVSKVSRIENGKSPLYMADLGRVLDLYKIGGDRRRSLMALAEASVTGDVGGVRGQGLMRSEYDDAVEILEWAPVVIPRIMRAGAYAEAVARSSQAVLRTLPSLIEIEVAAIARQQERLTRVDAPEMRAVLDESVLYRRFSDCDKDVMREQVGYLTELAGQRTITLRITTAGRLAGSGQFTYSRMAPISGSMPPDSVVIERLDTVAKLRAEEETWTYRLAFNELWDGAVSAAGTGAALDRAREHWA